MSECREPRCPCHDTAAAERALIELLAVAPPLDCSADAACECAVAR